MAAAAHVLGLDGSAALRSADPVEHAVLGALMRRAGEERQRWHEDLARAIRNEIADLLSGDQHG